MAIIKTGHRGWNHSGVKVYDNTAAPEDWTDLDLSAVVGKNHALVFLEIKNRHPTDIVIISFRVDSSTPYVVDGPTYAAGINIIRISDGHYGHIPFETGENGMMQWKASDPNPMDIWVLGYIR